MPLPVPRSGESPDEFVGRCMADEMAVSDFPDEEQRLAVCFRQFREEAGLVTPIKSLVAVEIKNEDRGLVEAVFSRFNAKDLDGDWTLPGAFQDGAKVRISAYGHASWATKLPVGRGTIKVTDRDARLVGQFFLSTAHGRDTFETVKAMGELQEWSYGYDVEATGELTDSLAALGVTRVLKGLRVHEVSPVLVGVGVNTRTISVKAYTEHLADEDAARREVAERAEALRHQAEAEHLKFIKTDLRLRRGI